jgi:hypothetical protein
MNENHENSVNQTLLTPTRTQPRGSRGPIYWQSNIVTAPIFNPLFVAPSYAGVPVSKDDKLERIFHGQNTDF